MAEYELPDWKTVKDAYETNAASALQVFMYQYEPHEGGDWREVLADVIDEVIYPYKEVLEKIRDGEHEASCLDRECCNCHVAIATEVLEEK